MNPADAVGATDIGADAKSATRDIFVLGASSGALGALRSVLGGLPADFRGSIFIVVHVSPEARSVMAELLDAACVLTVTAPDDLEPIQRGRVYVASPNRHMLLERDRIRIVRGPRENRHRPAIDPLFRSAAWTYGPRVVGVVLTGYLDDGAAGLWAIKSCGGTTVVQDPADAQHPEMPMNALRVNEIDYTVPAAAMADLLVRLSRERVNVANAPKPPQVKAEVEAVIMESHRDIRDMGALGRLSPFTCPGCRGALWELEEGDLLRYRCHTGHAYTADALLVEQAISIEESLYTAVRAMEEKAAALRRLGHRWQGKYPRMEAEYDQRAEEMDRAAETLRHLLAHGAE